MDVGSLYWWYRRRAVELAHVTANRREDFVDAPRDKADVDVQTQDVVPVQRYDLPRALVDQATH